MDDLENLSLNLEGNLVREMWKNSGFEDDFNRIKDNNEVSQELIRNLVHVGIAEAVENTYANIEESWDHGDLRPFNVRAIEVFGHAWEEYGDEVFETWVENPGYDHSYTFGDVDLYFPAGRDTTMESRPCIEKIYQDRISSNIEESANADNMSGEKYTANLDFTDGLEIEIDLMRPDTNEETEYSKAQEEPYRIETPGGAEISVPELDESILHKGTLETDNGDGHDTMRSKDYKELATLFDVAESREKGPEYFEETYEPDELVSISERAADFKEEVAEEWPYQPSDEYVSRITQWQHIYD